MAEYAHLSELDPEFAAAAAQLPSVYVIPTDLDKAREWANLGASAFKQALGPYLPAESEYKVEDHTIEVEGGDKTIARCIVPTPKEGEDGRFPVLFWLHGGGWAIGNMDMDDYNFRRIAVDLRVSIVNYDYRLAPEHPFPAAPNDSFTALKYFATQPDLLSADFSKGFVVGGASAGGNLSAILAQLARDDPTFKDTPITGQLLQIPALIHPQAYPEKWKSSLLSLEQNKDAAILPKWMMERFLEWYQPPPNDPKTSPLLHPKLDGLPPAYIQICGADPLRDEAFLYDKLLREVGVTTKVDVYPGVPHAFQAIAPTIALTGKFANDFRNGLQWILDLSTAKGQSSL